MIAVTLSITLIWYHVYFLLTLLCSLPNAFGLIFLYPLLPLFIVQLFLILFLLFICIPFSLASFTSRSLPFAILRLRSPCKIVKSFVGRQNVHPSPVGWFLCIFHLHVVTGNKDGICGELPVDYMAYGGWKFGLKPSRIPNYGEKGYEVRGLHEYI